ncbi:MAG: putative lipid II flippase FtsW [Candidatus Doudnabacteria bacterium]|nr:putative lipid II flippase FtsW [Candidatus Doudnabacteria bacterium]
MSKKNPHINYKLLFVALCLLIFGLITLYSASTVESFKKFGTPTYYILHQITYGAGLGLIVMVILSKIDYHIFQKYLLLIVAISLLLLLAVKIPGFGLNLGGASRWLDLGPLSFQPSELAKLAIVLYLAAWIGRKGKSLNDFSLGLLPSLIIICLFAGLILSQPDFGTMFVILAVAFFMLFVGGINWRYLFWSLILGLISLYSLIHFVPYRLRRITTFLNPSVDPKGLGYQINQALLAIGSGGFFGYGYGLSRQKYSYLPEVMGDSIFAIAAEELGFVRIIIVIILFGFFAVQGIKVAKGAPDVFGKLTAFGITAWITLQTIINIAAITKLIPLTGIPLPFFSYGSSALIINLAAVGILLNISKQAKPN